MNPMCRNARAQAQPPNECLRLQAAIWAGSHELEPLGHCRYNQPMTLYDHYARVYDDSGQIAFSLKMIPYLDELLQRHSVPGRSMLDLACGTGTVALSYAQQGWEVYAVDASTGMLDQARRKAQESGLAVTFSRQDMREFVLPHSVALTTCLYDSLNYMLTLEDLKKVLVRVSRMLVPNGLFLGDMNTQVTLEEVWGNNTFFVEREGMSLILRSGYEEGTGLSTVHIVGFVQGPDGSYSRFDEHHTEIAYDSEQVKAVFESTGLQLEASYECFQFSVPSPRSRRIMWVARKPEVDS
jgi:ubiquinone/menaquinone biosynthesis C-methylase UbiE